MSTPHTRSDQNRDKTHHLVQSPPFFYLTGSPAVSVGTFPDKRNGINNTFMWCFGCKKYLYAYKYKIYVNIAMTETVSMSSVCTGHLIFKAPPLLCNGYICISQALPPTSLAAGFRWDGGAQAPAGVLLAERQAGCVPVGAERCWVIRRRSSVFLLDTHSAVGWRENTLAGSCSALFPSPGPRFYRVAVCHKSHTSLVIPSDNKCTECVHTEMYAKGRSQNGPRWNDEHFTPSTNAVLATQRKPRRRLFNFQHGHSGW